VPEAREDHVCRFVAHVDRANETIALTLATVR
jgi:hypothetical protein